MKKMIVCINTIEHSDSASLSLAGKEAAWEALSIAAGNSREELQKQGISLEKKKSGKPFFKGSRFGVSISHTAKTGRPMAAAAVYEGKIGIDIERTDRESKAARRMFSKEEQEWLAREQDGGFVLLWTLRESYAKWTGLGLAKMPEVNFSVIGEEILCSDERCMVESFFHTGQKWRVSAVFDRQESLCMEVFLDKKIFFKKYWKNA